MKKIYVANCIECGERFISNFQTSETNKEKLYEMGIEIASGWGAECVSVKVWKPKVIKMAKMIDIKDNKEIELTQRKYTNWIKKHPKSIRYNYSKTKFYTIKEQTPTKVWDCDLSDKENLELNPVEV